MNVLQILLERLRLVDEDGLRLQGDQCGEVAAVPGPARRGGGDDQQQQRTFG